MEPNWMVHAGMAVAVLVFFGMAWRRYRNPARVSSRPRVMPQMEPGQGVDTMAAVPGERKAPQL